MQYNHCNLSSEFNTNGSVVTSIHYDEAVAEGRCTWSVTEEMGHILYYYGNSNYLFIIVF